MPSGGKRAGSGRKCAIPGEKRVQIVITTSQATRDKAKAIAQEKGVPIGRLFDDFVKTL